MIVADNGHRRLAGARAGRGRAGRRRPRRGYGNALMRGIRAARGTYVLMADADDSYDLENLGRFLDASCAAATTS